MKASLRAFRALLSVVFSDRHTGACFIFLAILCLACMFAEFFAPYPFAEQNLAIGASAPCAEHIFGTDILGRDVFTRILYGGRISFAVGFAATAVAVLIGACYGMVSALSPRRVDSAMMRLVDIAYALPFTILVILLMIIFGRSLWLIFVAIGAVEWLTMARIVRGMTLDIKSRQFVLASEALGQGFWGIMRLHILPNLIGTILVCATLTVPSVMLLESFLSFLGLGVQAPLPSWGTLVKEGAEYMLDAPWMLVFPAFFFSATLYCLNRVGAKLSAADLRRFSK